MAPETLPAAFVAVACGLQVQGEPTFEEWQQAFAGLERTENDTPWRVGDLLNYGECRYGRTYEAFLKPDRANYQTLRDQKWIAAKFELSRRRDKLSWSHHREVAALPARHADKMLDQAEAEDWTAQQLRRAVRERNKRRTLQVADAVCDEYGQPVPERLFGLWRWAERLRASAATLSGLRAEMDALPYWPGMGDLRDWIETVGEAVADFVPHVVCPRPGDPHATDCLCGGRGWLTGSELEKASEPDRKHVHRFAGAEGVAG